MAEERQFMYPKNRYRQPGWAPTIPCDDRRDEDKARLDGEKSRTSNESESGGEQQQQDGRFSSQGQRNAKVRTDTDSSKGPKSGGHEEPRPHEMSGQLSVRNDVLIPSHGQRNDKNHNDGLLLPHRLLVCLARVAP